MTGESKLHAQAALDLLSDAMKRSAEALDFVEEATVNVMRKHDPSFVLFQSSPKRLDRKLLQEEPDCSASKSATCTSESQRPTLRSCMMALSSANARNPMNSPFALPSLLCQIANTNSSCVSDVIGFFKTCACVDFQPLYNLMCPTAASASTCSQNSYVKRFLVLNAQNSSLGFFGTSLMNLPFPGTGTRPDLAPCGDADVYRQIFLINGMGPCLYSIVDAFPVPTNILSQPLSNTSLNVGQMIRGSFRCALTANSYRYQAYCSGNIARCFSLRQTPDFGACRGASTSSCPAGCKDRLLAYGASSSTSSAKCCVKWFQEQAQAEPCSNAPAISLASLMGPECISFSKTMMDNMPQMPGQTKLTPEQLNMIFNTATLPGQCAARSPASAAVQNCAVPAAGLQPACPDDSTPYVQASLFAPKQSTTATITFVSSSLKAVSALLEFLKRREARSHRCRRSLQPSTPKRSKQSKRRWNRGCVRANTTLACIGRFMFFCRLQQASLSSRYLSLPLS
jgi:hypothetical protein